MLLLVKNAPATTDVAELIAVDATVCDGDTVQVEPEPEIIYVPAVTPVPVIICPGEIVPDVNDPIVNVVPEIEDPVEANAELIVNAATDAEFVTTEGFAKVAVTKVAAGLVALLYPINSDHPAWLDIVSALANVVVDWAFPIKPIYQLVILVVTPSSPVPAIY